MKVRGCEDEKMICVDVKKRRCEDEKLIRVKMGICEDQKMNMCRCDDGKM